MKENKKIIGFSILILFSLFGFILQVFIFQYPDGIVGFLVCVSCVMLFLTSIIKLCQLSKKFKSFFQELIEVLFFWTP